MKEFSDNLKNTPIGKALLLTIHRNFIIVGIGMALAVLSFFFMMAVFMIMQSARRRKITEKVSRWNNTEGIPKGLYFSLGGDGGESPDDFWLGIYPRRIRVGQHSAITITNK